MADAPVVLIPDRLRTVPDIERGVFGDGATILAPGAAATADVPDSMWAAADCVLAWHDLQFTSDVIDRLKRCRVIVRVGAGFDNIDLAAAGRRGIPVCNVPDYGTTDVADHAIALLLSLVRGIAAFDERVRTRDDGWEWAQLPTLRRLAGSTIGIIGLGRIGTAAALRARAFGMNVVFFDPYLRDGQDKALGLQRCDDLATLLRMSDFVSVHTPLTPQTHRLVNAAFLDAMRPGALLVNTARGPIVDLDALENALRSGHLGGAGLDVLPTEPVDFAHPLLRAWRDREDWIADRLLITPHVAFYCDEALGEMRAKAAREAFRVLNGQPPRNCVNAAFMSEHLEPRSAQ